VRESCNTLRVRVDSNVYRLSSYRAVNTKTNQPLLSNGKNQRLLVQLYAPDDGRGDARNMLSHTLTSSNKLVKLLHLVG